MTFDEAIQAYEAHFGQCYPYSIGLGYPGDTDQENVRLIRNAIQNNTPVPPRTGYRLDREY